MENTKKLDSSAYYSQWARRYLTQIAIGCGELGFDAGTVVEVKSVSEDYSESGITQRALRISGIALGSDVEVRLTVTRRPGSERGGDL